MSVKVIVLGTVQDGGYPQTGCVSSCCKDKIDTDRYVSCISVLDEDNNNYWLIDITPDFKYQLNYMETRFPSSTLAGIFISHAHFGHYTGLLELGKEVMDTDETPVYTMPKMKYFLEKNDPWKQLILQGNIKLIQIQNDQMFTLNENVFIYPFLVPHRAEISETAGFKIQSESKSVIYIPDIDSWEAWELELMDVIPENDMLLLDGTFFSLEELQSRDIEDIPHPCINHTMEYLSELNKTDKSKIYFTHLNHTNNALRSDSKEFQTIKNNGFNIAKEGMEIKI